MDTTTSLDDLQFIAQEASGISDNFAKILISQISRFLDEAEFRGGLTRQVDRVAFGEILGVLIYRYGDNDFPQSGDEDAKEKLALLLTNIGYDLSDTSSALTAEDIPGLEP